MCESGVSNLWLLLANGQQNGRAEMDPVKPAPQFKLVNRDQLKTIFAHLIWTQIERINQHGAQFEQVYLEQESTSLLIQAGPRPQCSTTTLPSRSSVVCSLGAPLSKSMVKTRVS